MTTLVINKPGSLNADIRTARRSNPFHGIEPLKGGEKLVVAMRHGEDLHPGRHDDENPLSPAGRLAVEVAAHDFRGYLGMLGLLELPIVVHVGSSLRVRETGTIASSVLNASSVRQCPHLDNDAPPETSFDFLRKVADSPESVHVVVTHMATLSSLSPLVFPTSEFRHRMDQLTAMPHAGYFVAVLNESSPGLF